MPIGHRCDHILCLCYIKERDDVKKQLGTQQKLVEKQKEVIQKCMAVTKTLLMEKVLFFSPFCHLSVMNVYCELNSVR